MLFAAASSRLHVVCLWHTLRPHGFAATIIGLLMACTGATGDAAPISSLTAELQLPMNVVTATVKSPGTGSAATPGAFADSHLIRREETNWKQAEQQDMGRQERVDTQVSSTPDMPPRGVQQNMAELPPQGSVQLTLSWQPDLSHMVAPPAVMVEKPTHSHAKHHHRHHHHHGLHHEHAAQNLLVKSDVHERQPDSTGGNGSAADTDASTDGAGGNGTDAGTDATGQASGQANGQATEQAKEEGNAASGATQTQWTITKVLLAVGGVMLFMAGAYLFFSNRQLRQQSNAPTTRSYRDRRKKGARASNAQASAADAGSSAAGGGTGGDAEVHF